MSMLLAASSVWGKSPFWARVKMSVKPQEAATLAAIERVLGGRSEEMDLLLVRTAVVELMRGQTKDPRTVVLLFHLRRQLGLSPPKGGIERLSSVISSRLSDFDSALAFYELARLYLDDYFLEEPVLVETPTNTALAKAGILYLDRALDFAWEAEQRSDILFYRGMSCLKIERYDEAEQDLLAERELGTSRRSLMNAHLGLSLLAVVRGDMALGLREATTALEWQQNLAQANRVELLSEFPLSEAERTVFQTLLLFAREKQGIPTKTDFSDGDACGQLSTPRAESLAAPFAIAIQNFRSYCAPTN